MYLWRVYFKPIWIRVGQGPTALAVGAGEIVLTFFLFSFSLFWETVRYRQPTNQCIILKLELLSWIRVGQGPTAGPTTLAVGASRVCLDIFVSSIISLFFLHFLGDSPI